MSNGSYVTSDSEHPRVAVTSKMSMGCLLRWAFEIGSRGRPSPSIGHSRAGGGGGMPILGLHSSCAHCCELWMNRLFSFWNGPLGLAFSAALLSHVASVHLPQVARRTLTAGGDGGLGQGSQGKGRICTGGVVVFANFVAGRGCAGGGCGVVTGGGGAVTGGGCGVVSGGGGGGVVTGAADVVTVGGRDVVSGALDDAGCAEVGTRTRRSPSVQVLPSLSLSPLDAVTSRKAFSSSAPANCNCPCHGVFASFRVAEPSWSSPCMGSAS
mmetsp:Transcript_73233/g.191974  ORF Transcript_73233/g.191974 Transcript_73233/m.191974 type:complete len:268 (-) Transcript_73233:859-1662(-)